MILEDASEGYFIGDNTLIFLRQNALLAVGFDPRTLRVSGRETVIASGVGLWDYSRHQGLIEASARHRHLRSPRPAEPQFTQLGR